MGIGWLWLEHDIPEHAFYSDTNIEEMVDRVFMYEEAPAEERERWRRFFTELPLGIVTNFTDSSEWHTKKTVVKVDWPGQR